MSDKCIIIWKRHFIYYLKLGSVDLLPMDYEFMSIYFLLNCQIVALVVIDHSV